MCVQARMVEQAKTSGADMAKLWMVDRDSSEEEDADQSSRWTLRIQPPSIRGVVVDSDEDENYDDGRRSPPPGSPVRRHAPMRVCSIAAGSVLTKERRRVPLCARA